MIFFDSSNAKPRTELWRILTFGGWRRIFYKDKLISYRNRKKTKMVWDHVA